MRKRAVVVTLVVAALAAGCGSDGSESSGQDAVGLDLPSEWHMGPREDAGGAADTGVPADDALPAIDISPDGSDAGVPDAGGEPDVAPADVAAPDGSAPDLEPLDAGPVDTGSPLPACLDLAEEGDAFDLVPSGGTQYAAAVAFDGRALWMVYNEPDRDESGGFDVWATRLACDGSYLVPPFIVHAVDRGNNFDPAVAVADGNVYIAWETDPDDDSDIRVWYRSFRWNGEPLMAEERAFLPIYGGETQQLNGWKAGVAALPGRRFAVSAAMGVEKTQRFQAVVGRFEETGEPVEAAPGVPEDTIVAHLQPVGTQMDPAIAAAEDGSVYLAWTASGDDSLGGRVRHTRVLADATTADPLPAAEALPGELSAGASYAVGPGAEGTSGPAYLAFFSDGEERDIVLKEAASFSPSAASMTLGEEGAFDHSPTVVGTPGGGAVAWLRIRSGVHNDVYVRRFGLSANGFTRIGAEKLLNREGLFDAHHASSLGRPAVAHVGGYLFFVVWSEGENPDFRLRGRFVQL